jgi:hypothetical protein
MLTASHSPGAEPADMQGMLCRHALATRRQLLSAVGNTHCCIAAFMPVDRFHALVLVCLATLNSLFAVDVMLRLHLSGTVDANVFLWGAAVLMANFLGIVTTLMMVKEGGLRMLFIGLQPA